MSERDFNPYFDAVARLITEHLRESRKGSQPVVSLRSLPEIRERLDLKDWIKYGGMEPNDMEVFLRRYLGDATRLHHPRYLAHQVAVPHFAAALADFVNGMTNNGMAVFEMGPPAVAIELSMIDWLLEKAGWAQGSGVLTHGGSMANLTALLSARARAFPECWKQGARQDAAIMVPAVSHYSISRAAAIMGLGTDALYPMPADRSGVTLADGLPGVLRRIEEDGRRVMAVVANACATATGLYDPLEEIADFCRIHGYWLHVDGAHGAAALLSPQSRKLMRGLEAADSLIWDAHKMLQTSTLCAAVLYRSAESAECAFRQEASYLGLQRTPDRINLYPRALECTKAPLGLKLFLTLAVVGEKGLSRHVEELFDRARTFHRLIEARPQFNPLTEPQSNIVCFRYSGDDGVQARIRERLLEEGDFHVTSAEVMGRLYLRLSVMNPLSSPSDLSALLDRIEAIAEELESVCRNERD